MKKEDVELVLLKSFDYWKELLCGEIDLGDLHDLSNFIWDSIKEEQDAYEQIQHIYQITKSSLSILVTMGEYSFKDMYGNTILLKFVDDDDPPCLLESGTVLLWDSTKNIKTQQKITRHLKGTNNNTSSKRSSSKDKIEKIYPKRRNKNKY
jgi:hypothetical protein